VVASNHDAAPESRRDSLRVSGASVGVARGQGQSGRYSGRMRYDVHPPDLSEVGTLEEGDLAFAVFSLTHAVCGDDVLEVRIGEHALLEWCTACSDMRIFRPSEP
jgi:hypothetical protein